MKYLKIFAPALLVILFDQVIKLAVHFKMTYGALGEVPIFGDWFKLHYTLNPGMAFGLQLGAPYGKILLTVFRLLATIAIIYYMILATRSGKPKGLLFCVALVLGGAIGNLIDSIFYGVFLGNAPEGSPTPWFHGQVIDMFYLDIWQGILPDWVPLLGGQWYSFWPIFNLADASIFCGIVAILIFQNRFFGEVKPEEKAIEEKV